MQADVYKSLLRACLDKAPHCDAFMLWGFTDKYNWLSAKNPCILDNEYQPKPAFFALQETLSNASRNVLVRIISRHACSRFLVTRTGTSDGMQLAHFEPQ